MGAGGDRGLAVIEGYLMEQVLLLNLPKSCGGPNPFRLHRPCFSKICREHKTNHDSCKKRKGKKKLRCTPLYNTKVHFKDTKNKFR